MCGFPPFVAADGDQEALFNSILSGRYDFPSKHWADVSQGARDLITNMLQWSPILRFSAEDVLDDPWLAGDCSGYLFIYYLHIYVYHIKNINYWTFLNFFYSFQRDLYFENQSAHN